MRNLWLVVSLLLAGAAVGAPERKVIAVDAIGDFAIGFDEPKGICFTGKFLVTVDVT